MENSGKNVLANIVAERVKIKLSKSIKIESSLMSVLCTLFKSCQTLYIMGSFEKWERIKGFYNTKSCLLVVSNGSGVGIIEIENKIFHGQVK